MTVTATPLAGSDTTALMIRKRLAGLSAMAAGVALVIGHALTIDPNQPRATYLDHLSAHRTSGLIGGLLASVGAFLLIPAMTAVLRLVRGTGAHLATGAAILVGCGAAALGAGDIMITLVMGDLVREHPHTAAQVFDAANSEPLLSLPFSLAPLLVIGFVLLGVALIRARSVPTSTAALLCLGGVLVFFSGGGGLTAALCLVPLGLALALLGWRAVNGSGRDAA